MRAIEILKEVETLNHSNLGLGGGGNDTVTITVPRHLLNIQGGSAHDHSDEEHCCNECGLYEDDCMCETEDQVAEQDINVVNNVNNELKDILRLAGANQSGQNDTIAAPATDEVPEQPLMIPPLQQQIELFKQQGGKESPVINQIVNDPNSEENIGSTAGEQPEQSIYHDSPLEDGEFVGAGTGAVDNVGSNSKTTKGATKPWYKI